MERLLSSSLFAKCESVALLPDSCKTYAVNMLNDYRFSSESCSSPFNKYSCLRAGEYTNITRLYNRAMWANESNVLDLTVTQCGTGVTNPVQQTNSHLHLCTNFHIFKLSCDCCQNVWKRLWAWLVSALLQFLTTPTSRASVSFLVCNYQLYLSLT